MAFFLGGGGGGLGLGLGCEVKELWVNSDQGPVI